MTIWDILGIIGFAMVINGIVFGKPPAPVVTEQVLYWERGSNALCCQMPSDTHSITITLHDGEPAGIKIEALK